MAKSIKGKELGKGIGQREDGLYYARVNDGSGHRKEKCFKELADAKNWRAEQIYIKLHPEETAKQKNERSSTTMTLDQWFNIWIDSLSLAPNTVRNYTERYKTNVKPLLGNVSISDIRPIDCKIVFKNMEPEYANSTIRQAYIALGVMLRSAVDNGVIDKHPMDGVRFDGQIKAADEIHFLTEAEEKKFLEVARNSHNYAQYALLLETGLRTGEMIALTWDDIDWNKHTLSIRKTMEFRYKQQDWRAGPTKTKKSYRTIPLTDAAYEILKTLYDTRCYRKESSDLDKELSYLDRKTGQEKSFNMRELVFINWRTGMPAKNSSSDTHLYKLCEKAGIERFCMHALRHTYATRAIERGMSPKALQKLLGHSSIKTTMDKYVHASDDFLVAAVRQFQEGAFAQKGEQGVSNPA